MKKNPNLKLFGILGYPLAHTLSPAMHEAAFRSRGIQAFYLALEINKKRLKEFLRRLPGCPFEGLNVTVPYKEKVARSLSRITPRARAVKAVNTLYRRGSRWFGDNTDIDGFLLSLKRDGKFSPKRKCAFVFGAGGAARAVVYGLGKEQARTIFVCNRTPQKARRLMKNFSRLFPKTDFVYVPFRRNDIVPYFSRADIVINTTSVGLKKRDRPLVLPSWIPRAAERRKIIFCDLIYNPAETPFLEAARKKGHKTLNGSGMLVYQGALAWERWMRKKAPVAVMRKTLSGASGKRTQAV